MAVGHLVYVHALCGPCMTRPGSGHIGQGHNIQGTLCSRGATSKNFRSGKHRSGTHQPCILLGRGKRLIYMGREFAPSGTEVFRNHRKFPAIFTMKKGRARIVGSNSVSLDYYSCPLSLDHGYHVLNVKKYTVINIKYQQESIKNKR